MSVSEGKPRADLHRRRADRGLHGYRSVADEPFADSVLTPRGPAPWLSTGWAWLALAMAVLGCVANRALDRDVDSALEPLQPAISVLACVTALAAVYMVWQSAQAHRALLVRDDSAIQEFFRARTELLDLQPPSRLSQADAEARVAQTKDERKEITIMARQVNSVMFLLGLVIVMSASAVLTMAWGMHDSLTQILSWLEVAAVVVLVLAVLPTFDRRWILNLHAAAAVRRNEAQVKSWMSYGRPHGQPQPSTRLENVMKAVRTPATALSLLWLVVLAINLLAQSV